MQGRVDMEAAIGCLDIFGDMVEKSGPVFEEAFAAAKAPSFTVAQMYKKMDKTKGLFDEKLATVNFDKGWYDSAWTNQ